MLEVRVLGVFSITSDKHSVVLPSRSAQSLFAYLILNAGTAYRREKLAGQLWPDSTEEAARDYLRHAIWRIRKALKTASATGLLQVNDLTVAFAGSADYWLDAAIVARASESRSAEELMTGLAAYEGELLPGFYEEWVVLEREHLQAIYEQEMGRLLDLLQVADRWSELREWAEKWIALGQKPEPAFRALMLAHAANGDMSKVAASYERCLKSLREFGVEPSEQTKLLYEAIRSGKHSAAIARALTPAPPKTLSNIPVPLTSFIGRESDLQKIAEMLPPSRLVTLTGPGGVGKTRLAIAAAHESLKTLKDGAAWVSLADVADPNLIPQEISRALQVREIPSESLMQTLVAYLSPKALLLVLDNCEHLIGGCARIVEQLLAGCPGVYILATSIESLGLFNETIWQVPPLPLPDAQEPRSIAELRKVESIKLFEERAQKVKPGFALDERNAAGVVKICQRLDGIPLAIELAAARTRVLALDEIASRLDDRFSLLTAGSRTAVPRHQTLRAVIDWSYDLLSDKELVLFRRLAVFEGGCTLEAAESVIADDMLGRGEVLDHLSHLVDKSLVLAEQHDGITRFRMLQTIQEYARVRLAEAEELERMRGLHFKHFLEFAEAAGSKFEGPGGHNWLTRAERDFSNLRAALAWGVRTNPLSALEMIYALTFFWLIRGHETEGRIVAANALKELNARQASGTDISEEDTAIQVKGLLALSWMMYSQGDNVHAVACSREAADLARSLQDSYLLAGVLGRELLGRIYMGDVSGADEELAIEGYMCANAAGDAWEIGLNRANLGQVRALTQGDYEAGRDDAETGISLLREAGGLWTAALTMGGLAMTAKLLGKNDDARLLLLESLPLFREIGDRQRTNLVFSELAHIERLERNYAKAEMMYRDTIVEWQTIGHRGAVANQLECFAFIAEARSENDRAVRLLAAAQSLRNDAAMPMSGAEQIEYQRALEELRKVTEGRTFATAWHEGRTMSMQEAVDFALRVER